jgi:hypothetical protein
MKNRLDGGEAVLEALRNLNVEYIHDQANGFFIS